MINFREKTWYQGSRSYRFWALLTPANKKAVELFESGKKQEALDAEHAERMRLYDLERKGIIPHQILRLANGKLREMLLCLDENGDDDGGWPFDVFTPNPPCEVEYLRGGPNPWAPSWTCPHTPNCMRR